MTIAVFVCVDLEDSNPFQRETFESAMLERDWEVMNSGFCASVEDVDDEESVLSIVEQSIAECIDEASILDWDATCILSRCLNATSPAESAPLVCTAN